MDPQPTPDILANKCPRCAAAVDPRLTPDLPGATSRVTRDGGARVVVCGTCGEREAMRAGEDWEAVPLTDWPVSIDTLLSEDRLRLEFMRNCVIGAELIGADDAQAMLDGEGE